MPGPPTGNITLMFTDIQDSTTLWERMGDGFRPVLDQHNALVREGIARWDGYEVKCQGDSFMVAFSRPTDAVQCAAELQRELPRQDWPEAVGELLVRIGLHTGEPFLGYDSEGRPDYFGPMVNRAARIADAGHGGQILVSLATREVVSGALTADFELADLGRHRLRGLEQAEVLFEVRHPELPQRQLPPLRTTDAVRTNLPEQLTSFIGREKELAELRELLHRPGDRLLTLTGTGGCGKTRLALRLAADMLEEYGDGIWLVELAPLADPALLPRAVATALRIREEPNRPVLATLTDYLRAKELSLILDNCEHLIADCAQLAEVLLKACPKVHILATSREALGIMGEAAWRVPSLSAPDPKRLAKEDEDSLSRLTEFEAVRLFAERASLFRPGFTVTKENALAVAQTCYRLDGIPLAIELAAARAKAMPVEQLAARLDDRFRLLTGGSRTALPRQQTLRATIDWSYDLLSDPERVLLRRLAVFVGGWTLEAAESVCADEHEPRVGEWGSGSVGEKAAPIPPFSNSPICFRDVLDLLTELVAKSLVLVDEVDGREARYRFLETVRQYARDRLLESGEAAVARGRHSDWFLSLAERAEPELRGPNQAMWLAQVELEHDNLRAALEWSAPDSRGGDAGVRLTAALCPFWHIRGHTTEGRAWLSRVLPATEGLPTAIRATCLQWAGVLAWQQAEPAPAQEFLEESLAVWERLGDKKGLAGILDELGNFVVGAYEDFERGRELLEQSLGLRRELGDQAGMAAALNALGFVAMSQQDYERARALSGESLAIRRQLQDKWGIAWALRNLGAVAMQTNDWPRVEEFYREALELSRDVGHTEGVAASLINLAAAFVNRGNREQAHACLVESFGLYRNLGSRCGCAYCLFTWGQLAHVAERPGRAVRLFAAAEALWHSGGMTPHHYYSGSAHEAYYEALIADLRATLGDEAFEAAWAEGRAMSERSPEEAVAYAMEDEGRSTASW